MNATLINTYTSLTQQSLLQHHNAEAYVIRNHVLTKASNLLGSLQFVPLSVCPYPSVCMLLDVYDCHRMYVHPCVCVYRVYVRPCVCPGRGMYRRKYVAYVCLIVCRNVCVCVCVSRRSTVCMSPLCVCPPCVCPSVCMPLRV